MLGPVYYLGTLVQADGALKLPNLAPKTTPTAFRNATHTPETSHEFRPQYTIKEFLPLVVLQYALCRSQVKL